MQVPTLVIGVGMGGIRVLQTLADMARQNDDLEYYRFIAIDSSEKDLEDRIKDRSVISKIAITETGLDIGGYIRECPYLPDGLKAKGVGAVRDRAYARFLLDINIVKVNRAVSDALRQLRDLWKKQISTGTQEVLIWLVHSLGGGTGSGSFPTLAVTVSQLAKEILGNAGIKTYIYCVGILPSASNIQDISFATFDRKFLANSYAALTELNLLADPKGLSLSRLDPSGGRTSIPISERPFDRYFLFGLNEDQISNMKDDEADEVEEYLKSSNKVIANMMYALPHYPGGLENLWHNVRSPFITFSESELYVPLTDMKRVAEENDRMGRPLDADDKKRLANQARMLVELSAEEGSENLLETSCRSVLTNHGLRGLSYFIGKLQNEFTKAENARRTTFEEEVSGIWEELGATGWAEDEIKNSSYLTTSVDRYKKILELFRARIEDNQQTIDSPMPRPFLKRRLEAKNNEMSALCRRLEEMKDLLDRFQSLLNYINNDLCKTLRNEIGHQSDGVAAVVAQIRTREVQLEGLKRLVTDSGWGRVVKLGVPKDLVDTLSLVRETNVLHVTTAPSFVSTFGIDNERLAGLITNRIAQASSFALKIAIAPATCGNEREAVSREIFIVCNDRDEPLLSPHEHLFGEWKKTKIKPDRFPAGRYVFINFLLGLQLEDIRDYTYRKAEYETGQLSRTTGTDRIGTIFAHPEWFPDDPHVQAAFSKLNQTR